MAIAAYKSSLVKINQVSFALGIPMATIRTWEKLGRFPASVRLGGRIRYWQIEDLRAWVNGLEGTPTELKQKILNGMEAGIQGINN